jgi:hypothetical protein
MHFVSLGSMVYNVDLSCPGQFGVYRDDSLCWWNVCPARIRLNLGFGLWFHPSFGFKVWICDPYRTSHVLNVING